MSEYITLDLNAMMANNAYTLTPLLRWHQTSSQDGKHAVMQLQQGWRSQLDGSIKWQPVPVE